MYNYFLTVTPRIANDAMCCWVWSASFIKPSVV